MITYDSFLINRDCDSDAELKGSASTSLMRSITSAQKTSTIGNSLPSTLFGNMNTFMNSTGMLNDQLDLLNPNTNWDALNSELSGNNNSMSTSVALVSGTVGSTTNSWNMNQKLTQDFQRQHSLMTGLQSSTATVGKRPQNLKLAQHGRSGSLDNVGQISPRTAGFAMSNRGPTGICYPNQRNPASSSQNVQARTSQGGNYDMGYYHLKPPVISMNRGRLVY